MNPFGNSDRRAGFSLLEVTMAILLLGISFVGLTAYSGSQRKALGKSGDLTEAAGITLTTLEKAKIPLSDSAAFVQKYESLSKPSTSTSTYKGKVNDYTVATTLSRVSGTDNLIKAKVKLTWTGHEYETGMLLVQP